jgi:hypothetical protein
MATKQQVTITGTWDSVKLMCTHRHKEPVPMEIKQGPSSLFYACPKYYPQNRDEDERACNNRLNLVDYERMLSHVNGLLRDAELNDEKVNLKSVKWKDAKGTLFEVLSHDGDGLVVSAVNKRAINA